MNKIFMNRLTMLAVTLMASMACFAQGKFDKVATELVPHEAGAYFDLNELRYYCDKVASGVQELVVVGFATYVCDNSIGDPTLITSKWNGKVTIPGYIQGSGSCSAWVKSVAANAFTTTVCSGDDHPNRDKFADAAALVTKLDILYDDLNDLFVETIGSNAFAGLPNIETVKTQIPSSKVISIPESAFASDVYDSAYLDMVSGSIKKYHTTSAWSKFFYKKLNGVLLGDYDGDGVLTVTDIENMLYSSFSPEDYDELYDYDGDGTITVTDLENFLYMSF